MLISSTLLLNLKSDPKENLPLQREDVHIWKQKQQNIN